MTSCFLSWTIQPFQIGSTHNGKNLLPEERIPFLSELTPDGMGGKIKNKSCFPWKCIHSPQVHIAQFLSSANYWTEKISILHGCIVWIEKSVTRVTDQHHEACRVMPNSDPEWQIFLYTPYTHDRYSFLHTFWFITFDFQKRICYKPTPFPLKTFYSILMISTLSATPVRFLTLTSYLHKVTSFLT